MTLRRAAELVRELCRSRAELRLGALPYRAGEMMTMRLDTGAIRALGWAPARGLAEGLRQTIEATEAEG